MILELTIETQAFKSFMVLEKTVSDLMKRSNCRQLLNSYIFTLTSKDCYVAFNHSLTLQ